MKNRRKYDRENTHDLLSRHMEEDATEFSNVGNRLIRIEIAIYAAATALALFVYLIDHPKVINNLSAGAISSPAMAGAIE